MIGKFIGTTSMGFVTGQEYELRQNKHLIWDKRSGKKKVAICLFDLHSDAWCPYDSWEAIFRNWEFFEERTETPKVKTSIEYEDF